MTSHVILHLSERFLQNYDTQPHLKLQARVKDLIVSRGGTVGVRTRAERCRDPKATDWSDLFEPEHLHLVENGLVRHPGVLNTALAYLPPFYHLDACGALANSSAAQTPNGMDNVNPQKVERFWNMLQSRFVDKRRSRYSQPVEVQDIPVGCIAIFLQGENPQRWGTAHCDTKTMIRTVAEHAGGRPVVVKAHPISDVMNERNMLLDLMSEGLELYPTDANIHDILRKCVVTVSFNSAVAIEGFLYNKPAILFGRSDFHHCCEAVREPSEFVNALAQALDGSRDYQRFLYWYFTTFCLSLNDPEVDEKIMKRFAKAGFSAKRLGLAEPSSWKTKLLSKQAAAQTLEAYLMDRPEVNSARGLGALKVSDKSWVFSARVNGEKVVVKRFLESGADQTVHSLKNELDYLEAHFGDSDCRANRCLMSWPHDGVAVLSFAPGPRLGNKIADAKGRRRKELLTHSGRWLAKYTEKRRRDSTFGPGFWLKQLLNLDLSHITDPADLHLLAQLIEVLRSQKERVKGCAVVQAATHGDFVGINAHFHKGIIYGVDIQGECWLAVAKEAARFLVWLQIHNPERPARRRAGIDEDDWNAFLQSKLLDAKECHTTLPFFVGEQFYERFVENYSRTEIRTNARAGIEAYVNEKM